MDKHIEEIVEKCDICQVNRSKPSKAPLHSWPYPEKPWERVHIDYAGPFYGKMFLVVIDAYSKWLEVRVMNNSTAASTIVQLRDIFSTHGLPNMLVSDNGSQFTSEEFHKFMLYNGIKHVKCAPFHPSSNGLAERAVQTFKNGLKKMRKEDINTKVVRFLFRYRCSPQSVTGVTPAELLMGRKLHSHLAIVKPDFRAKVIEKQAAQKRYHDRNVKARQFEMHDKVLVSNYSGRGDKWLPGVVIEITGPVSYKVKLDDERIVKRHVDQIRGTKVEFSQEKIVDSDTWINDSPAPYTASSSESIMPSVIGSGDSIVERPVESTVGSPTVVGMKTSIGKPGTVTTRSGRVICKPQKLDL
jgi:hypothetical protein